MGAPKVELGYLEELINSLCTRSLRNALSYEKENFVSIPLKDWMSKLETKREFTIIEDIAEVEPFIKKLVSGQEGQLNDAVDLRKKHP